MVVLSLDYRNLFIFTEIWSKILAFLSTYVLLCITKTDFSPNRFTTGQTECNPGRKLRTAGRCRTQAAWRWSEYMLVMHSKCCLMRKVYIRLVCRSLRVVAGQLRARLDRKANIWGSMTDQRVLKNRSESNFTIRGNGGYTKQNGDMKIFREHRRH